MVKNPKLIYLAQDSLNDAVRALINLSAEIQMKRQIAEFDTLEEMLKYCLAAVLLPA